MHKSQKASVCSMSASLQSKQANVLSACKVSFQMVQSCCGPWMFSIQQISANRFKDIVFLARPISSSIEISALFRISAQSALAMRWFCSLKMNAEFCSQSINHQYGIIIDWYLRRKWNVFHVLMWPWHSVQNMSRLNELSHTNAWIENARNPFQICTVTMCSAIMRETWGSCAQASQCGENRCDATCWRD